MCESTKKKPSKEEIYVKKFLLKAGIKPNKKIDYKEFANKLRIEKEFFNTLDGMKYTLIVIGTDIGVFKIAKPNMFKSFGDEKLNKDYKVLMSECRIKFEENGSISYHSSIELNAVLSEKSSIARFDEILNILSKEWQLKKNFNTIDKQKRLIKEVVEKELRENMGILIEKIYLELYTQVISKLEKGIV